MLRQIFSLLLQGPIRKPVAISCFPQIDKRQQAIWSTFERALLARNNFGKSLLTAIRIRKKVILTSPQLYSTLKGRLPSPTWLGRDTDQSSLQGRNTSDAFQGGKSSYNLQYIMEKCCSQAREISLLATLYYRHVADFRRLYS